MVVLEVLSATVPVYAATTERDRLNEELRQKPLLLDDRIEFSSLRAKADAMAAKQSSSFKLHQVGTVLEFPGGAPRIKEVEFDYFQPAPDGGRWTWEELRVFVKTPIKLTGGWSRGNISGARQLFEGARPTPAPSNIIAPDKAIGLLNRGPMNSPEGGGARHREKDSSRWNLTVQLIQTGAKYWAGNPGLFPTSGLDSGHNGLYLEEPFFVKTAPRGKWVWWTVVQHAAVATRYEYIYMDAVTGRATPHCAEQPSYNTPLVAVPCAAPR